MKDEGVVAEPFEVFLIEGQPGSTLSTVICRLPDSNGVVDFLKDTIGLLPEGDKNPVYVNYVERQVGRSAPSGWWVDSKDQAQYYASKNVIEGGEGDMYLMASDEDHNRVYLYYYFNF